MRPIFATTQTKPNKITLTFASGILSVPFLIHLPSTPWVLDSEFARYLTLGCPLKYLQRCQQDGPENKLLYFETIVNKFNLPIVNTATKYYSIYPQTATIASLLWLQKLTNLSAYYKPSSKLKNGEVELLLKSQIFTNIVNTHKHRFKQIQKQLTLHLEKSLKLLD